MQKFPSSNRLFCIHRKSSLERRNIIRKQLLHNATTPFSDDPTKIPLFFRDGIKDRPDIKNEILRLAEEFVDMVLLSLVHLREADKSSAISPDFWKTHTQIALWCNHTEHALQPYAQEMPYCNLGSVSRLAAITACQLGDFPKPKGVITSGEFDELADDYLTAINPNEVATETKINLATELLSEQLTQLNTRYRSGYAR